MTRTIALAVVLAALAGCSTEQAYSAGQAWKTQECERIVDERRRAQCLEGARVPYQEYRRERGQ